MISLLILLGLLCYFAYELMATAIGVGIVILVVVLMIICGKSKKKSRYGCRENVEREDRKKKGCEI